MEIKGSITITLTEKEVCEILKNHFSKKYDVKNVKLNIG